MKAQWICQKRRTELSPEGQTVERILSDLLKWSSALLGQPPQNISGEQSSRLGPSCYILSVDWDWAVSLESLDRMVPSVADELIMYKINKKNK